MKKFLTFSGWMILCAMSAIAQKGRFGIHAGAALSSYRSKSMGITIKADSKIGFIGGVVLDAPLNSSFSFQPSLDFIQKGGVVKVTNGIETKSTITLNYFELPLNVLFKPTIENGRFFFGAGPSIGLGISGKDKEKLDGQESTSTINFGSSPDQLKAFDIGLNVLAGFEFRKGILLTVNYSPGFRDLSNDETSTFKNHYFGLTLGYLFPAKGK